MISLFGLQWIKVSGGKLLGSEQLRSREGRSMMVGNSLRSDVLPAIEAGAWGVFVPHELIGFCSTPRSRPTRRASAGSTISANSLG